MINRVGKVFGRLTVISFSHFKGEGKKKEVYWLCECVCGERCAIRSNGLTSGHAKSCGCLKLEIAARVAKENCTTHGMSRTVEWDAYEHAKQRCTNPKDGSYSDYGGRGIKFLFTSFEQFFAELGLRPKGKTLDRFPNNNGNYEPGNVRWATAIQQANNKRSLKGKPWSTARRAAHV